MPGEGKFEGVSQFPSTEIVLKDLDFYSGEARGFLHMYETAVEEEVSIAEAMEGVERHVIDVQLRKRDALNDLRDRLREAQDAKTDLEKAKQDPTRAGEIGSLTRGSMKTVQALKEALDEAAHEIVSPNR